MDRYNSWRNHLLRNGYYNGDCDEPPQLTDGADGMMNYKTILKWIILPLVVIIALLFLASQILFIVQSTQNLTALNMTNIDPDPGFNIPQLLILVGVVFAITVVIYWITPEKEEGEEE
jgi:uncharacterized membrane protein YgaE (UPF0421/DUF939 family)